MYYLTDAWQDGNYLLMVPQKIGLKGTDVFHSLNLGLLWANTEDGRAMTSCLASQRLTLGLAKSGKVRPSSPADFLSILITIKK